MHYKEILEKAYQNKKVLLTGHTGFKGTWMLCWLQQLGAIVKGYALTPENTNDLYNLVKGDELCDSEISDIRDKEKLSKTVTDFQPDFIFHLAAQPLVRRSYEMPLYTFEVNVSGTAHLLESLRELKKPCSAVIVTTDKVYENREADYAYKESDKLGGYDPYSASKAAAEIVVSSYRDSFFNPADFNQHRKAIATARAGNVIGGGDWATDRIVPDIIRSLQKGEPVIVRNPGAIRPWQHVLEPLSGYLLLGARLVDDPVKYAGAWNFGPAPDDVLTVKELVDQAIYCFGKGRYTTALIPGQKHEAQRLQLDITKAKNEMGWVPGMNAHAAIQLTVDWYKEAAPNNALVIVREQIAKYQSS